MATATTERGERKWLRRLGWLVAIWLAGVACLGLVALLVSHLMHAVGLAA